MKLIRWTLVSLATILAGLGSSVAADLRTPAPVYTKAPPAASYSWAGIYIGGFAEYGINFTNVDLTTPFTATLGTAPHGFGAGGQVGLRTQAGQWVFGLRGEVSYLNMQASTTTPIVVALNSGTLSISNATNYLGSVSGQLGYAIAPRFLAYLVGGFAFGGAHPNLTAAGMCITGQNCSQAITDTSIGYTVGGGLEYAVADNLSLFIEGDYYHLGDRQLSIGTPPVLTSLTKYDIAKQVLGINLHF